MRSRILVSVRRGKHAERRQRRERFARNASADDDGISEVGVEDMPGARAMDSWPRDPMTSVANAAETQVAKRTAVGRHTRFCEDARVYDDDVAMARNVVRPERSFAADGGAVFPRVGRIFGASGDSGKKVRHYRPRGAECQLGGMAGRGGRIARTESGKEKMVSDGKGGR